MQTPGFQVSLFELLFEVPPDVGTEVVKDEKQAERQEEDADQGRVSLAKHQIQPDEQQDEAGEFHEGSLVWRGMAEDDARRPGG